jgi:uncharacterized protein (DUF2141 family)
MVKITGNVIDSQSGAPIENATVVLGKDFALTGETGAYTITDLKPGQYTIVVIQRYFDKYEDSVLVMGDTEIDIALKRE